MQELTELKTMTVDDLNTELLKLRKMQFDLRIKKAHAVLDKTHIVRGIRKNIARVKTIISQRNMR